MIPKYKVGDKVKIREDLELRDYMFGVACTESMCKHRGEYAVIRCIYTADNPRYLLRYTDGEEKNWRWTEDMFEDSSCKEKPSPKFKVGQVEDETEKGFDKLYKDIRIINKKFPTNKEVKLTITHKIYKF